MDSKDVAEYWESNAETWTALSRSGWDVYRDALNTPAFMKLLPDISGLTGLDIGCGEGTNTRLLAEAGAKMAAIDIAPTFIKHARQTEKEMPLGIDYRVADATDLPFPENSFDFAAAFMSFMDIPDQSAAMKEACRILRPGGFFQFSILHPCFVPPKRRTIRADNGDVVAVEVSDYFLSTDGQVDTWCFSGLTEIDGNEVKPFRVPRFHRTLGEWVSIVRDAGLMIDAFGEPMADAQTARDFPQVADTRVTPIFLHFLTRKPV